MCNASSSILCASDADCPDALEGSCVAVGLCSGAPAGSPVACILGSPCEGLGACQDVDHHCTNAARCDADAYATPSLEIAPLAGAALALGPALETRTPEGQSPLGPALQGGITHAAAWQAAHPGESAAVVLVTDALPTTCEPLPGHV